MSNSKEINMQEVFDSFSKKFSELEQNNKYDNFLDITRDSKRNPSRMPAFQVQLHPDYVIRVHIALPNSILYIPVVAELHVVDRDHDSNKGIFLWRSYGYSIDEAVENLFDEWNRREADDVVQILFDSFQFISEDRADAYDINPDILNGTYYRKPKFIKNKENTDDDERQTH